MKGGIKMHAHFGDPLILDVEYFYKIPQGKKGTAILEGYVLFDLDHETDVRDISGNLLGKVKVISTTQTKKPYLNKKDIKAAGYGSQEMLNRALLFRYPNKKKIEWITVVKFFPTTKIVNRVPEKKEEKHEH